MGLDLRTGFAGVVRMARLVVLPSCAAMIYAKLASVWALSLTPAGAAQVRAELAIANVAAWFAPDLGAAIMWALVVALACGWSFERFGAVRAAAVAAFALVLAVALTLSVEVVRLFAMQPQRALLAALSRPTDASDSILSLVTARVVVNFVALAVISVGGMLLLYRLRARVERRAGLIGAALSAAVVVVFGVANFAPKSAVELDRNPLLRLATSYFRGDSVAYATPAATGSFGEVLHSVTGAPTPAVDLAPYQRLKKWAERERPNVVLIIWESTAPAHMGAFGAAVDNTPITSALKAHGISWPKNFGHAPTSMFAIYSIVASNHGTPFGEHISLTRPRIAAGSLSELLTAAGYRAGLFHSGHFSFFEKDLFFAGRGYDVMYDALSLPNREDYIDGSWGIEEKAALDAIVGWAGQHREEPLFVTYIPFSPHHPYDVPRAEYRRRFAGGGNVSRYRSAIYYMDAMVGELIEGLGKAALARDTLFILVGDHGEGFGEHPGSFMHGLNLYQEGVASFVVFYAATMAAEGAADPRNFGHVDIAPTLLDILGLEHSPAHVGKSAFEAGTRPMIPLYSGRTARKNVGFVDGNWKFMIDLKSKRSQLFDLANDPGETKNVAAARREWVATFSERALAFMSEQKAWEASLADVDDSEFAAGEGKVEKVSIEAASCERGEGFALEGGRVSMVRAGTRSISCSMPMAEAGQVTSFIMMGRENIAGALISATMQWRAPSGQRQVLAHCILNGNAEKMVSECEAVLAVGRTRFGTGGSFEVEIRYTASGGALNGEHFGVERVEISYVPD